MRKKIIKRSGYVAMLGICFITVSIIIVSGIDALILGARVSQRRYATEFYRRNLDYRLDSLVMLTEQRDLFSKFEFVNDLGVTEHTDEVNYQVSEGIVITLRNTSPDIYTMSVSFPYRDIQKVETRHEIVIGENTWNFSCTIKDDALESYTVSDESVTMELDDGTEKVYAYKFGGTLLKEVS